VELFCCHALKIKKALTFWSGLFTVFIRGVLFGFLASWGFVL
jgi:hypothetical protein